MKPFVAVVILLTSMVVSAVGAENLLVNGSFDAPDVNFDTDDASAQWAGTGWAQWGYCFRQRWAAHSGHAGGYFRGWWSGIDGAGIYQDVARTGGTYTVTLWMRRESAFDLNLIDLKVEWLDSSYNCKQTTFGGYSSIPADGLWHPIYVTSTYTNTEAASWLRVVIYANWGTNSGGSLSFDDAQLYPGAYTGATSRILNPSFEFYTTNDIRGSQWSCSGDSYYPLENPWEVANWAPRMGSLGLAFRGWLTNFPNYEVALSQVVTPGVTGTYTFAGFISREAGFLMTNAQMRLDVYDQSMTNLLQSAVTNITVPGTTNFAEYYVTLNITNESMWEVRPSLVAQWLSNTNANESRALRMDDFSFYSGGYTSWVPDAKSLEYIYFNYTNAGTAQNEDVPGLGGVKFFDYHYASNEPSYVYMLNPQGAILGLQTRFYFSSGGGELWRSGAWYTNVVIDSANAFHGYPSAGSVTMEVWRTLFWPPSNWRDSIWYAQSVKLASDGLEWWTASQLDDASHPITTGVALTNNWPSDAQRFWSRLPIDHDYYFYPTGRIDRWRLNLDWAYHGNTNAYDPKSEIVPGFTNVTFLQKDYANTQTIFWLVTERPANIVDYESLYVQLRISYPTNPPSSDYVTEWLTMSWYSNVVLDAAVNPFHGLPAIGKHTVDLWRVAWNSPLSNGVPDSRLMNVYYAPFMKTLMGSDNYETDYRYFVSRIDGATNLWGSNNYTVAQFYGGDAVNHDYLYIHQWTGSDVTDGIPNSWWEQYAVAAEDRVALGDLDDDGYLNIEEYAGDTVPTNNESHFSEITTSSTSNRMVINLVVDPSSTGRVYDAYWKTNLMEAGAWQNYGLSVTGNGAAITLTVTNKLDKQFYRTGAQLP